MRFAYWLGRGEPAADQVRHVVPQRPGTGELHVPVRIPLLVLGGLALLLLAAGGAGYLSRRAQARRNGGPPGPA